MFQLIRRYRRTTAATFVALFLHVLVGQIACAQMHLTAEARPHQHAPGTPPHEHGAAGGHAHQHPSAHAHQHDHAAAGKHTHAHAAAPAEKHSDPKCCQDDAKSLWAALGTPPKVSLEKFAPMVLDLPPAHDVVVPRFVAWDLTQAVTLVPPTHLKPKIPDIRIFIGSLTI